MCKMLGSEPNEEEMPIEREDLTLETQEVFNIFDYLPARWDSFSGMYLGKDLSILPIICEQFEVPKYIQKYCWLVIPIIDNVIAEDIAQKIKRKTQKHGDAVGRRTSNP